MREIKMKRYTINRKDLIKQEYNLAEAEEIENKESVKSIDGELENFIFELFKIANMRKSNDNMSHFISDISRVIITNTVCIKIHLNKMEMKLMFEEIVSYYIEAVKKIKSKNYTIEEISVIVYETDEDRVILECHENNYNETLELGA